MEMTNILNLLYAVKYMLFGLNHMIVIMIVTISFTYRTKRHAKLIIPLFTLVSNVHKVTLSIYENCVT